MLRDIGTKEMAKHVKLVNLDITHAAIISLLSLQG